MSGQFGKDRGSPEAREAFAEYKHDTGADATVEALAASMSGKPIQPGSSVPSNQSIGAVRSGREGPEGFSMEDSEILALAKATGQGSLIKIGEPSFSSNVSNESLVKLSEGFGNIIQSLSEFASEGSSKEVEALSSVVENGIMNIRKDLLQKLNSFKAIRIAESTRKNSKSAKGIWTTKNGMRTEFNILGQKISMKADGKFTGDEYFHLDVDGEAAKGIIVRKTPQGLVDASAEYKIDVKRMQ